MVIERIAHDFSVCCVEDLSKVDFSSAYVFVGKTDSELSLVCQTEHVPENTIARVDGWKAFRIQGTLDFSLIGILADLSARLAENGIGIFALSTFNTDYILTKSEDFAKAIMVLEQAGYDVDS